jgi:hypothetical protein
MLLNRLRFDLNHATRSIFPEWFYNMFKTLTGHVERNCPDIYHYLIWSIIGEYHEFGQVQIEVARGIQRFEMNVNDYGIVAIYLS